MPTTGVINTTSLAFYVLDTTYKKVGGATGATLTFSMSPRDTTSKDSGGYRTLLEGLRSWSISGSGLVALDDTFGAEDLYDDIVARSQITVRFMTNVSGDAYFKGVGYFSELTLDSPGSEENVTYSYTFEGTSSITKGSIT